MAFRFRPPAAADSRTLSLDVARYTPQAVLLANVEEARYDSLVTDEGKRIDPRPVCNPEQPAQLPRRQPPEGRCSGAPDCR